MNSTDSTNWGECDLSELIAVIESGQRPYGGATEESGEIPSLGGENIRQGGGLELSALKKVPTDFYRAMTKGVLQNQDVLINKDGANTGKAAIYNGQFPVATINEHLFLLRGNPERLAQRFLYCILISEGGQRTVRARISGSAQPGLKSDFIRNFPVRFPKSTAEQARIATVLDTVDEAIAKTEAVIAKLKQVRTGLLHDLLTRGLDEHGQLRDPIAHPEQFKESLLGRIPREWHVSTLGAELTLQRGFDITVAEQRPGNIPVVSSSGITSYHNRAMVPRSGVVTGRKGKLGDVYYLDGPFWPHDTTLWVKDFHGNSERFGALFLSSMRLDRFDAATSVPTLNRNFIHPLPVAFPSLPEQERLVSVVEAWDSTLRSEQEWLDKLQSIKQGLMTDLLTGRVHVPERIGVG